MRLLLSSLNTKGAWKDTPAREHRFGPLARRRRFPRPVPSGFRRTGPVRRRRQLFRDSGVRARKAGFLQRVVRLVAALADPEPHVAYFFKRLLDGLRGAGLVPVSPPAAALGRQLSRAVALADSS